MPKYEVSVVQPHELVFEVEAVSEEHAEELAATLADDKAISRTIHKYDAITAKRKLAPQELVFKMQIENIRRDYDIITSGKLPSGETIDEPTVATMKAHLITLHDTLVTQSGLDIPKLDESYEDHRESIIKEHFGQPDTAHIDLGEDPQVIWERAASKLGWHWDPDYKGWIKPENRKPGKIHGEWDAFVRDMEAEDACNEEGIDTLEEAKNVILGKGTEVT